MKLSGRVIFKDSCRCNQVTAEGASAVASSLSSNSMVYLSNILYITDRDKLNQLMRLASQDLMQVTWESIQSLEAFNKNVYSTVVAPDSGLSGKGGIIVNTVPQLSLGQIQLSCKCTFDVGVWPSSETDPILAMAFIVNGNLAYPPESFPSTYIPSGGEKLFSFIVLDSLTQFTYEQSNEFMWELTVSVDPSR